MSTESSKSLVPARSVHDVEGQWYEGTKPVAAPTRTPAQQAADRAHSQRMRGNTHAASAKVLRDALRKALYRRDASGKRKLDALAEQVVDDALQTATGANSAGISAARREVFDRIGGKAVQQTELSGAGGGPISVVIGTEDTGAL